ncbi:MAG: pseudouridine-5'-phosphate glycosidase [Armatimonadota bacterium]|nr:pseudouridine-5'-phosphate glycosidase [Armatimonadota bacterium]MDR7532346.1 pseudouridine-5'-phosphate glycosidase [Armatimonadota bacterium]MDR7535273.1 pseudouridine-5'-phosphate glycosidase [Armatimonadota bacterium]
MTGETIVSVGAALVDVSHEVVEAVATGAPVVALESAVFSHGLPPERARTLARRAQALLRQAGVTPALCAVRAGQCVVGAPLDDLAFLLGPGTVKVARRDLPVAVARGAHGGTTVSATLALAHTAGVATLATGGIGGVHVGVADSWDVSPDLGALAQHPLMVVCTGAKALCDIPKTVEALETAGVTVVGYRTATFPAFYAGDSGVPVPHRVETPDEVAAIAQAKGRLGDHTALLVVQPPPAGAALDAAAIQRAVAAGYAAAAAAGIGGAQLTPYLLAAVDRATGGAAVAANLALLEHNIALAAAIEGAWAARRRGHPQA